MEIKEGLSSEDFQEIKTKKELLDIIKDKIF